MCCSKYCRSLRLLGLFDRFSSPRRDTSSQLSALGPFFVHFAFTAFFIKYERDNSAVKVRDFRRKLSLARCVSVILPSRMLRPVCDLMKDAFL